LSFVKDIAACQVSSMREDGFALVPGCSGVTEKPDKHIEITGMCSAKRPKPTPLMGAMTAVLERFDR
jgi:hypothetical protein